MPLALKKYQQDALDAIASFLSRARGSGDPAQVERAFVEARAEALGEAVRRIPYRSWSPDGVGGHSVPLACIRIPTGGGKTLLAAHAIDIAARQYVGTGAPIALWLVPSNAIRTQTLDALQKAGHPYREALLDHFAADRLTVIDIADCTQLRAQDFGGRAIVVVGTIQTLRVDNTAGREVYSYNEAFEPHFAAVPDMPFMERIEAKDLEVHPYLKPSDVGRIKRSFANLLAWHRPIVIVDEAHNAQTTLSFEVFRRIRPACMLEWTATPAKDQNALYHVSAQELKAENMIKLPIVLASHPNWKEAVRDAVLTRERLAQKAAGEPEYIRPIVLFQADAQNRDVPVDVLKAFLVDELRINGRRIAVATGSQRELDGIDLFDRACPIDFIVTVEALKEGWDCSFAYVFCTVQNVRSAKDMEQLLGRVLRLPYAKPRTAPELNRAYAHVCSESAAIVAGQLGDRLVDMGFEEVEIGQFLQPAAGDLFAPRNPDSPPAPEVSAIEMPAATAATVAAAAPGSLRVETRDERSFVIVTGELPPSVVEAIVAAAPARDRESVRGGLDRHVARCEAVAAPSARGVAFEPVPQLCVPVQGALALLDPDLLAELASFSPAGAPADLPAFTTEPDAKPWLIDVEHGHLTIGQERRDDYTIALDLAQEGIRREDVIRELARRARRDDVLHADLVAWLGRAIDRLEQRGITLTYAARHLNRLAECVIATLRSLAMQARGRAFQQALFGEGARGGLSDAHVFRFGAQYPYRFPYTGRFRFRKHYYPRPGDLDADDRSEETVCAIELDGLDAVRHWVRNLERQPSSFWLPTSTDRFYPDFVAELTDGRLFVVEYKGGHLYSAADAKEKRDIGKVWAAASGGRCLFAMVTDATTAARSVAAQLRGAMG